MKTVKLGLGNFTLAEKISVVSPPHSAPIQRAIQEANVRGKFYDLCGGRKRRAVIILDDGKVLSSIRKPETIISELAEVDTHE